MKIYNRIKKGINMVDSAKAAKRPPPLLAIIVPCYNEEMNITRTSMTLEMVLDESIKNGLVKCGSFLLFVDDGSADNTWHNIEEAHLGSPRIRGVMLSRNYGHQNAIMAGLLSVMNSCDAAITIDADLQQDPDVIPLFLLEYIGGADVVFGIRTNRTTDKWLKRISAEMFYRIMAAFGVDIIPNHADYRLLSRMAIINLSRFTEGDLFLRSLCLQLSPNIAFVNYEVKGRIAGETKYTLAKMLSLAISGITSFSSTPLRLIALIGVVIFTGSLLMMCYVLWRALFVGDTIPGWASTALPVYALGAVQILCLAIVSEYIGKIYNALKNRPRYLINKTIE